MKLLSCAESARIDREGLLRFALNQDALIEQAGLRLWEAFLRARRRTSPPGGGGRLVFLAGPGNNGRDAQVMARLARAAGGFQPAVIFSAPAARGAAEPWLRAWGVPGLLPEEEPEEVRALLGGADYIIDGLCGTGLTGPLRAPEARLVAQANASPAVRLALDLPSGARDDFCPGDPVFQGRWTLTIALPKTCLYLPALRPAAGRIILVPLAFPPALLEDPGLPGRRLDWSEARTLIPGIPPEAHKYRRGHCAVFAGLPRQGGALGAGILAARGAAAGPAGLVSLYLPDDQPGGGFEAAAAGISAGAPELLVKPESAGFPLPPTVKSLVAGPGWGGAGEGRAAQLRALFDSGLPGVLDADGLRVFAGAPELHPPRDRWVFTPHSGEFGGLTGLSPGDIEARPLAAALDYAERERVILVLKGPVTFIAYPGGRYVVVEGLNPSLAAGGSGDVLAGIIGGLLAAGLSPQDAAAAGVCLHQEAGRLAFRKGWFAPGELLPFLRALLGKVQRERAKEGE